VPSTAFYTARSRVANLTKTRPADDPELTQLRQQMCEQFLVDSITAALDKGPALTTTLRSRIDALLASREIEKETVAAVQARAQQLADSASPRTDDQALLMVPPFARHPASGHDTADLRGEAAEIAQELFGDRP